MRSATWGAMLAIGAALGGLFTVAFGRTASFLADAASFAIAALLIASVRKSMGGAAAAAAPAPSPRLGRVEAEPAAAAHRRQCRGHPLRPRPPHRAGPARVEDGLR